MSENEKRIPKRRFKEFENAYEWEQCKLGDIVDIRSGRDYKHLSKGEIPVYGTGGYMLSVNEALSYKEDAIGIGRKGTIDKPYILKAPFWTVDTLFYGVPEINNDLDFIYGIFQNINWRQKDESTGVPSLSKTVINDIDVLIPEYEEQKQIGNFFENIDHLIIIHQHKLEKIKALKKAYLTNMFPQEEESTPKLRFDGFTGDWKQRKFSDNIVSIQTGTNLLGGLSNTGIPLLKMGNIQRGYFSLDKIEYLDVSEKVEEENIAYYGDFFFNTRNTLELVGKGATWTGEGGKYAFNSNIARFAFKGIDTIFFNYLYNTQHMIKQIHARAMGTTSVAAIYPQNLNSLEYKLPSIEEQKKIGKYFTQLDHLITLYQRKLEKLQNIKKAYLNEMFI